MAWRIAERQTRLNIIGLIILLVGLAGAITVY